jgi:non-ribosomal peptide synthetase component E (peptide arylation enzyme)
MTNIGKIDKKELRRIIAEKIEAEEKGGGIKA